MLCIIARSLAVAVCVSLIPASAWAGGAYLYENGGPSLGTAQAGQAALAQDASTVLGNPAGMVRLDRSQLMSSLYTLLSSTQFRRGPGTTLSGGNGFDAAAPIPSFSSASVPLPAGSFAYVYSLAPDFKLGAGFASGYGAGLNYGKTWAGRYNVQKVQLLSATLNPGFAYRLTDWLSVGAGFSVTYTLFSQTAAINNLAERLADGRYKFKADDWGFGGNAGVLIEPSSRLRFGITYRSPVDFSYSDRIRFTNVGPGMRRVLERAGVLGGETTIEQTAPQTVMVSWYYAVTKDFAVTGNFGWQNWKEYGDVGLAVDSDTVNRNVGISSTFHDTWHEAIGMQYRLARRWLFSTGFSHDSSPVSKFHRTPNAPLDENFRYGVGLQYDWSERMTVGAAYEYLDLGHGKIAKLSRPAGTLQGEYPQNSVYFVALNVAWKF
jgi:long-chain fatty acid transport protein